MKERTLETIWKETQNEFDFKVYAIADGYEKDEIVLHFNMVIKSLTPLQRRRLRKKKILAIMRELQDDRTLAWIGRQLLVTKQNIHSFYSNAEASGKIPLGLKYKRKRKL